MKQVHKYYLLALFYVLPFVLHAQQVQTIELIQGEYFIDIDPGVGNATPLSALNGSFTDAFNTVIANGLNISAGNHTINIRVKDYQNNWSPVFKSAISVQSLNIIRLTQAEYFIDTDPGQGSAIAMLAFNGNFNDAFNTVIANGLNIAAGNHTINIRVKDYHGNWSPLFTSAISVQSLSTIQLTQAEYFIDTDPGQGHGIVMLSINGSFNDAFNTVFANGITIPGGAHTINVRVKDSTGMWSAVFKSAISVECTPINISITGVTNICQGGSTTLTASAGASYIWSSSEFTPSITKNVAGTYCVTVTNAAGCTGTACQTITVNPNPTPVIIPSGSVHICPGYHVTLDAGVFSSYIWSDGDVTETTIPQIGEEYYVTVTDMNGCTGVDSIQIFWGDDPIIHGNTKVCQGGCIILFTDSYSSYIWSTGFTSDSIIACAPGIYNVTVTDSNGCTGSAGCDTIIAEPNPMPVITGTPASCANSPATLSVGTYSSYKWSNGATGQSITVSVAGTYSITVTNQNGCSGMASHSVTHLTSPTPAISYYSLCNGATYASVLGTYNSYEWNTSNGSWTTDSVTQQITILANGNYCVTVSYSNGCTGTSCEDITLPGASTLHPVISYTSAHPCTVDSVQLCVGSYSSYLWNNGKLTSCIYTTQNGTYTVTVTFGQGCSAVATVTTNFGTQFKAHTNITPPNANICSGSVILDGGIDNIANAPFSSYLWGNGSIILGQTEFVTINTSGAYTVTVANEWGCTATASATVNVGATAKITQACCNNIKGLTLVATASASYHWSPNAHYPNLQTDTVETPGTYCVTVTNIYGCTATACYDVTAVCAPPAGVAITNLGHSTATVNWDAVPCAVGYTICISPHNCFCWTCHTITGMHYTFSKLLPNLCYDVKITTDCTLDDSTSVSVADTIQVCTLNRLVAGEGDNSTLDLNVYPNPTNGNVIVAFNADKEDAYSIRLIDVTGRIVQTINYTSSIGENQYQMNLSSIAKGVYMVILQNKDAMLQSKIVVQ